VKCRILYPVTAVDKQRFPTGKISVGTILDDADCYELVLCGCAEPADEECAARCPVLTEEQKAAMLERRTMMELGIAPEDRQAYRRGWMRGYNPDGSWIPGPKRDEFDEDVYEEDKRRCQLGLSPQPIAGDETL
jgi:hypothetical protein